MTLVGTVLLIGFILSFFASAIRVLGEHERAVIYRLGKFIGVKGPGLILLYPYIDRVQRKVDMRTITMDVPPQDVITQDNVSVKVNAVVYFKVIDPRRAVIDVEDYNFATAQLAQTTLRAIIGQSDLDEILSKREQINLKLQEILDRHTDPWGIKVSMVELKDLDLPKEMQRAMARQAEAERERRSKVISAEGELQASEKLMQASQMLSKSESAIQLRYLQTITEITNVNKSHTVIFPLPMDIVTGLTKFLEKK